MAFDASTSSVRAILFDRGGAAVAEAARDFQQHYPRPGWVEHDPHEIWSAQLAVAAQALERAGARPADVAAIGITNQRETTVVWDRATGEPVMRAICWQDRRTAPICEQLREQGLEPYVRATTGLLLDAYFSGTKLAWILDNVPGARERAERGELLFGTIDSWLIWKLTGGRAHVTDYTNASRTILFDIAALDWDERLLEAMRVPRAMLPQARPSGDRYGETAPELFDGAAIPVASAVGDQQAALFGQGCFEQGMAKATYGTGASLMLNTGQAPVRSEHGLLTTVACGWDGRVDYALEGLIYTSGGAIQWLRDELGLISSAEETEAMARRAGGNDGVYLVPAYNGLAAPYWDQYARAALVGLSRRSNRDHVARAALESMAYQIRDVLDCMASDSGLAAAELKVDGGAVRNDFLMQFQADLLGVPVLRPTVVESTARGAAFLAGLATGFWSGRQELRDSFQLDRRFDPDIDERERERLYAGWRKAVTRALDWEDH